jgi:CHAT domain-containing protein
MDTNLVSTYNNLGIASFFLGHFEESEAYYQEAIAIIDQGEISENRSVAMCYQNTGILYATLGNYELANRYIQSSLKIFENFLPPDDPSLGRLYLNLGRLEHLAGQVDNALMIYDKAESIFRKNFGPDYSSIGIIFLNKANIYSSMADYERALNYNTRALTIFREHLNPDHPNILTVYLNIGYYHEKKEDYIKAIEFYEKSINSERITPFNIKTYRNLANLYSLLEEVEVANDYFNKAIDYSVEIFGNEHPETALSYANYARHLTENKHYEKSHRLLNLARNIYLEKLGPRDRDYANTLFRLGNNYLERGNPSKALSFYQQSIIAITTDFQETDPMINPTTEQLIPDQFLLNAFYLKAKALQAIFVQTENTSLLKTALETYELSSVLINKIRGSYLNDESQFIITDITSDILIGALDCSLDLYDLTTNTIYLEKAFGFSEKSKATVLLSSINDLEARQLSRVSEKTQNFERDLRYRIDSYNQLIHEERFRSAPDEIKIKLWQSTAFHLSQQYDSLIQEIYRQYPDYYDLKFNLDIISLSELQNNLNEDQVMIEFTMDEKRLYIFAVTADSIAGIRYPLDDNFKTDLETLRTHLTGSILNTYRASEFQEFADLSYGMYRILINPIEQLIKGKDLIIVPDNQLGYLPFEILLTENLPSATMDFKNLPYLIFDHSISYAYSATLHQKELKIHSLKTNRKVLAFAPSYEGQNDITGSTLRYQQLLPIPWAAEEAKSIVRSFKGMALIDEQATEKRFKEKAGNNYMVLHLAMHTIIDNENPMFSKLIFSSSNDSTEDGMLNTYELFNLELNADLAVLSACKTGDGRLQRGEGIMSMARGFFYAGVPSIVMTLWEVDDLSSSQLITLFYDYLNQGLNKDQALRKAKLEYLETTDRTKSHPHYWAGFVNIGNTDPVNLSKNYPIWPIALILAILFLTLAVYLPLRKRNSKK